MSALAAGRPEPAAPALAVGASESLPRGDGVCSGEATTAAPSHGPAGPYLLELTIFELSDSCTESEGQVNTTIEDFTKQLELSTAPEQLFIVQQHGWLDHRIHELNCVFILSRNFVDQHKHASFNVLSTRLTELSSRAKSRAVEVDVDLFLESSLAPTSMMPSTQFKHWKDSGWQTVFEPARGCDGGGAACNQTDVEAAVWRCDRSQSDDDGSMVVDDDQETLIIALAVATESGGERPFTPLGARADWPGSRHFVATSTDVGPCCRSPGPRCPSPRCRGLRVPPPRRRLQVQSGRQSSWSLPLGSNRSCNIRARSPILSPCRHSIEWAAPGAQRSLLCLRQPGKIYVPRSSRQQVQNRGISLRRL